jgi:hypothetical protein
MRAYTLLARSAHFANVNQEESTLMRQRNQRDSLRFRSQDAGRTRKLPSVRPLPQRLFEIEIWWELASLITIMVLGHWLEMRAMSQARGALNALAALLPDTAERVSGAETQTVPLSELRAGDVDVVLVRPGARVPAGAVAAYTMQELSS